MILSIFASLILLIFVILIFVIVSIFISPKALAVSAGRALLSVYVSDPAATVGLALGQLVSLGVTTKKCPSDEN